MRLTLRRWGSKVTINGINSTSSPSSIGLGIQRATPASPSKEAMFAELFKKLKEEASKTPEERAKDRVLEKNNLSEEDYNRLPRDKRQSIDLEIQQAVRRVAEQRRAGLKNGDRVA